MGLAPTTASVLGLPLMQAMHVRYPDVRLHLVESLSGNLASLLQARLLDLAVLFETSTPHRWSIQPLLDEKLFVLAATGLAALLPLATLLALLAFLALPVIPHLKITDMGMVDVDRFEIIP